tara:strand:- start:63 stop:701 length:639 start_codon:yes stop_codon:yes gene_type:complete
MSKCSECGNSPCDCEEKPKTIIRITKGARSHKSDGQDIPSGWDSCSECEGNGYFSEVIYEEDELLLPLSDSFNIVDEWINNNPEYATDYPQLAVLSQLLTIGRSKDESARSMYDAIRACFVGIEAPPPLPILNEIGEEIEECENCKGRGFVETIEECWSCGDSFSYGKLKRCCRPFCRFEDFNFICKICFKREKENQSIRGIPNPPWCGNCL